MRVTTNREHVAAYVCPFCTGTMRLDTHPIVIRRKIYLFSFCQADSRQGLAAKPECHRDHHYGKPDCVLLNDLARLITGNNYFICVTK